MNDLTKNAWFFDLHARPAFRVAHLWEYGHCFDGFYPSCNSMVRYVKAQTLVQASGEFRKCKKCIRYEERLRS